jgi:hypothetical protein
MTRPVWWVRTLQAGVAGIVAVGAFFSGVGVERSGNNPVSAAVPVVGDKPKYDVIVQEGQPACNLRDRQGYLRDDGCPVAVGKGFRHGFHTVRDGWTLKGFTATMVVVNDNPGPISGMYVSLYLNRYDGGLVEILKCESEPFATGEARAISCKPPGSVHEKIEPVDNVWVR